MSERANELTITYGALSMGGSSTTYRIDRYREDTDYAVTTLSLRVLVSLGGADETAFTAACAALEAALRGIDVDVTITIGSTTRTLSHASSTGFNSRASYRVSEQAQTARSRLYDVGIAVQRPADASGFGGLRGAQATVSVDGSGRMQYVLAGTYTATSSGTAFANYTDGSTGADARAQAATSSIASSPAWEKLGGGWVWQDVEQKLLSFTVTYRQIGYRQSTAGGDHASLVGQSLVVRRERASGAQDTPDAVRPTRLFASYSVTVPRAQTTDLAALWEATVSPLLYDELRLVGGGGAFGVDREVVKFDREFNRIEAEISGLTVDGGGLLSRSYAETLLIVSGAVVIPALSGDAFAAVAFQGPGQMLRLVTEDSLAVTGSAGASGGGGNSGGLVRVESSGLSISDAFGNALSGLLGDLLAAGGVGSVGASAGAASGTVGSRLSGSYGVDSGGLLLREQRSQKPFVMGLRGSQIEVTYSGRTATYRLFNKPSTGTVSSAPSGGGRSGSVGTVNKADL